MPLSKTFTDRLRELRGSTEVKVLAKDKGVSPSTIYKAEAGEEKVNWKTIEDIYGDFCQSEDAYADLLMLWAMGQSERQVGLYRATEALKRVKEENAELLSKQASSVVASLQGMPEPDQRTLVSFSRLFRANEPTRMMVKSWMEAIQAVREQNRG